MTLPRKSSTVVFTDAEKAGWALAHVMVDQRKRLNAALSRARKPCHGTMHGVPDKQALQEALTEAEGIAVTLRRALKMIG